MATIKTKGMPREYTETLMCLVTSLEMQVYGEVTVFYKEQDDGFSGRIANRGVIFFFTICEVGEQMLNGVSGQAMATQVIANYRKFLPTRFIKEDSNNV